MYFQSNILKWNAHYQSIQVRKKLFKESFVQIFLKNLQNSQEKTCVGGLFNKVGGLFKMTLQHKSKTTYCEKHLRTAVS